MIVRLGVTAEANAGDSQKTAAPHTPYAKRRNVVAQISSGRYSLLQLRVLIIRFSPMSCHGLRCSGQLIAGRQRPLYGNELLVIKYRFWRAPWKGGAFQWVKVPPGKCSSRKQPEQLWR